MGLSFAAPLAGCDSPARPSPTRRRHFNPRAPCGARRVWTRRRRRSVPDFNPRAPCGARPIPARVCCRPAYFNPRAPCGARRHCYLALPSSCHFNPRAPCGARRWCYVEELSNGYFNPRAPCGARRSTQTLDRGYAPIYARQFQSTRPLRGATKHHPDVGRRRLISIHAPLAGRDLWAGSQTRSQSDFNPRAPCGARRAMPRSTQGKTLNFNPRAPCGARPLLSRVVLASFLFQSTRPLRGATFFSFILP